MAGARQCLIEPSLPKAQRLRPNASPRQRGREATMDLHESIEQYQQQFMRDVDAPDHELRSAALALLEEFLGDYASLQTLEALSVEDLEEFFIDWYLRRPGAQTPVAVALLGTVRGWLGWCDATYGC